MTKQLDLSIKVDGEEDLEKVIQHLKAIIKLWWASAWNSEQRWLSVERNSGHTPAHLFRGADSTGAEEW